MSRILCLLPLLAIAGCPTTDKDDTAGSNGGGDSSSDTCTTTVKSTMPADGSTTANYRADIYFELSAADTTATITTDIPGVQQSSSDGKTIYWIQSGQLDSATSYTATLDYCGGTVPISFTTSEVGTGVDAGTIADKTYALDLAHAHIAEPPGIGSVLSTYLTQQVLIGVESMSGSDLQMLGALAVENSSPASQDYCSPSIPFPAADFSENPFFAIGPQDTTFSVAGYDIDIESLNITGSFAPDGTYIDAATLSGTIDTRPLSGLLDDSGNEAAICELAVSFGATCENCPSDGQPYCLTLVADGISADNVPGALAVVAGSNCTGCESGPPAEDATCE